MGDVFVRAGVSTAFEEEDEEDVDAALQLLLVVANMMMWLLVCAAYFFLKEYPRAVFRSARVFCGLYL